MINYEQRDEYFDTILRAKQAIQAFTEESLHTNRNTSGIIFSLINNYGWKQKQEVEHTGDMQITLTGDVAEWSK